MAKTIVVLHLTGQYPLAGVAFHTLHYLLGLARLGYHVYAVEDSDAPPHNPQIKSVTVDRSFSLTFVGDLMQRFGFGDRWAWSVGQEWAHWKFDATCYGLSRERLSRIYEEADAILNLYGCTQLREEHLRCPVRIYAETDPVIKQIAILNGDAKALANLRAHTHHFTYGENLGTPDCPVPLPAEFDWHAARPAVVLDLWECRFTPEAEKFTTVSTWRNDRDGIVFRSRKYYWSKHVNFQRFSDLPRLTSQPLELALGGVLSAGELSWLRARGWSVDEAYEGSKRESVARIRSAGWSIVDAYEKSSSVDRYRQYIYESRGEFTVANDLVAATRSGWFDPRSVCYLAAGKPVVLQETGFSKFIPTGKGLFSFDTAEEAAEAIKEINANYRYHCQEARSVAERYFDSDVVLPAMLSECGLA